MKLICMDFEGVLVPEIWIEFAHQTGHEEFCKTTRDEPNYDVLMNWRLERMRAHNLKLEEIQRTIEGIEPLEGAREFLDELRSKAQVIIISDTFTQFAMPLMKKLGWPTLFCNELIVDNEGFVSGYTMRCKDSKYDSVKALTQAGFEILATGDSFNDLGMFRAANEACFFRTTQALKGAYHQYEAYESYDELLCFFYKHL